MRSSEVGHDGPVTGRIGYWLARLWMAAFRWDVEGDVPQGISKAVLIAAPHTSNWDLPHMIAAALIFRVHISWMGKHTLFRWPFGAFMRWLGGMPIDRRSPQGMVGQMAQRFRDTDRMVLAVPPSGTRKKSTHWRTGFYHIAREAGVPVVCAYLDYSRRRAGLGHLFVPTGDLVADTASLKAFYADKRGKHPDNETPVELVAARADG
ncbi:MAG: lysophospholipid acyltransferase family protein [Deltaproteobacteria bacterium]|nr:lysophospholipid acyltransferase family protein [Deltaproteobacteria bacterium]